MPDAEALADCRRSATYLSGSAFPWTGSASDEVYTWDLRGRMKNATVDGTTTTFAYDSNGVRTAKSVTSGTTTTTTRYVNDAQNPTGYAKAVEELNDSGNVTRGYLIGLDVAAQADGLHGVLSLVKDGHGSTRSLDESSGTPDQSFDYDAYGNLLAGADAATPWTDWLAADGRRDLSTGLDYILSRYIDRDTGQFVSYDSFESDVSQPARLMKYAYTSGSPVSRLALMDTSGRCHLSWFLQA